MGVFSACFGCGACKGDGPLQPRADRTSKATASEKELTRGELKQLYEQCLTENGGRLIVHGIFARANTKNNNRRIYPKHILRREVAKFEEEHIWPGTALGELDHPNYASRYFKCLNLSNISHQVLEVHWDGDKLLGTIEVLPSPSGLLLWELYRQGIKLGVSSRGWASLRTDPRTRSVYVDDDFELITFDFVTEPSTHGAFLVPISHRYPGSVPDQRHAVQVAHLGHGVVSMRNISHVPDVPILVHRINQLQQLQQQQSQGPQGLQAPAPALYEPGHAPLPQAHVLDQLLLYSHYLVLPGAGYLDREPHARDYHSHLAMFATRAHLADQAQRMTRADLNAIILREVTKEACTRQAGGADVPGYTATLQQQQQQRHDVHVGHMGQAAAVASGKLHSPAAVAAPAPGGKAGSGSLQCELEAVACPVGAGWGSGQPRTASPGPGGEAACCAAASGMQGQPMPPQPPIQQGSVLGRSCSAKPHEQAAAAAAAAATFDKDLQAAWALHPCACPIPGGLESCECEGYQEGGQCSSHSSDSLDAPVGLHTTGSGGMAAARVEPGGLGAMLAANSSTRSSGSALCLGNAQQRDSRGTGGLDRLQASQAALGSRSAEAGQGREAGEAPRLAPWEASLLAAAVLQADDGAGSGEGARSSAACSTGSALSATPPLHRALLDRVRGSGKLTATAGSASCLEDEPVVAVLPQGGVVQLLPSPAPAAHRVVSQPQQRHASAPQQVAQGGPVHAWGAQGAEAASQGSSNSSSCRSRSRSLASSQRMSGTAAQAAAATASARPGEGTASSVGMAMLKQCPAQVQPVFPGVVDSGMQLPGAGAAAVACSSGSSEPEGEIAAEFVRIRGTLATLAAKLCAQRQSVQSAYQLTLVTDPHLLGPQHLHLGAAMLVVPQA